MNAGTVRVTKWALEPCPECGGLRMLMCEAHAPHWTRAACGCPVEVDCVGRVLVGCPHVAAVAGHHGPKGPKPVPAPVRTTKAAQGPNADVPGAIG